MTINAETMVAQCLTIKVTPFEAHQIWIALSDSNPVARRVNAELFAYIKRMKVLV